MHSLNPHDHRAGQIQGCKAIRHISLWLTMPLGYELYVDTASLVFHKWLIGLYADRDQLDNPGISLRRHLSSVLGEITLTQRLGSAENKGYHRLAGILLWLVRCIGKIVFLLGILLFLQFPSAFKHLRCDCYWEISAHYHQFVSERRKIPEQ